MTRASRGAGRAEGAAAVSGTLFNIAAFFAGFQRKTADFCNPTVASKFGIFDVRGGGGVRQTKPRTAALAGVGRGLGVDSQAQAPRPMGPWASPLASR